MESAAYLPNRDPRPGRPALALGIWAGALVASAALVLSGCAAGPPVRVIRTGGLRAASALVTFASCGDALRNLRAAASSAVGSGELAISGMGAASRSPAAGPAAAAGQPGAGSLGGPPGADQANQPSASGSYSGTNTAVAGVDEPDLVKTDGRHIVTVIGGVLRVIDAQTRQLTGILSLSAGDGPGEGLPAGLLLAGDHALVLFDQNTQIAAGSAGPESTGGLGLMLVDVSAGMPRIIGEYTIDGSLVDARQVGPVARVVVHSMPRLFFPSAGYAGGQQSADANRAAISRAALSSWLPRYTLTSGSVRHTGLVNCADVSHPATTAYSGTSMLTVLTFDLSLGTLGDGQPVTVVADGDTVYSNGGSLYIASERSMRPVAAPPPAGPVPPAGLPASPSAAPGGVGTMPASPLAAQQYTALYKFDISGSGRPVYQASGTVPGWLLGSSGTAQYALSEWNGALRVATTTGLFGWSGQPPLSAVYVLEQVGSQLSIVGKVGGLGQGEQIYAVRFAGPVGYVVTYRQVDPLYTLDLSDPAQPRVAGDLLLSGYSAYLDPIDATHLIGIGQATNALGQIQGTQISLFDVSDLAAPTRLAVYHLQFGHSEAEFDPHAFLYWPATRLLVIPVQLPSAVTPRPVPGTTPPPGEAPPPGEVAPPWPVSAAIVLYVGDHTITRLATITGPAMPGWPGGSPIRRSLIADNALWTLSEAGLKANDLTTLTPLGWIPFE
jgi:hypothetical protein